MSRTVDFDKLIERHIMDTIKWAGEFVDEHYNKITDKENFPFSVTINFPEIEVANRKFLPAHSDWHTVNRQWLSARKCMYKCNTCYTNNGNVNRVYYFRTKGEAMCFGLWVPRKV